MTSRQVEGAMNSATGGTALEARIISSALWAAAGDAIGWITELSNGPNTVKKRIGKERVSATAPWVRHVGGLAGPKIPLPAGTYSDDTQLRLATSRSIRGDGEFDPEAFAKVELTVWPAYALGGGRGTKAAATNLARRNVNWFSNFYDVKGSRYFSGGGNGACMRIQPHVWSHQPNRSKRDLLLDVLRNALITHGHPHGFLGAMFHALALADALFTGRIFAPEHWGRYVDWFAEAPSLILADPQLSTFWLSAWEIEFGSTLESAVTAARSEAIKDVDEVVAILSDSSEPDIKYHRVLEVLGCLNPDYRGSGLKTSIAACALAWIFRDGGIEEALILAANELDSDTDTIATMAGAILGATKDQALCWVIQDKDYLLYDAERLAAIGRGELRESFKYPDLSTWHAPSTQASVVGQYQDQLALAGLGTAQPISDEYVGADGIWQWLMLAFGQTVLAKRKKVLSKKIARSQMPGRGSSVDVSSSSTKEPKAVHQHLNPIAIDAPGLPFDLAPLEPPPKESAEESIDRWTEIVINSKFDDRELGKYLNRCIDSGGSIESAVAFASIIAKAKLARGRKR
ncbi:ADP-ribosylglycohydrolase family protein [Dyella sp. SG609]|uniref:ADP-ribosylglycohydrolase family protein n=1 Tax=Dyella sp. SG609 TaxID=2587018 RepID=UPI001445319D|nr:ADP-ribosylglycohydrolase family protein [Dyella sp. SG609]NKJ23284.1 ADP-ribosylglycohydrolase [Dyella sp. SG609]